MQAEVMSRVKALKFEAKSKFEVKSVPVPSVLNPLNPLPWLSDKEMKR